MEDVCCSEKKEIKENEDMTIKLEVDIYGEKKIFLLKKEHKERERESSEGSTKTQKISRNKEIGSTAKVKLK